MGNPIDHLLAEHRDIMAQIAGLRRAVRDLEERGAAALPAAMPELDAVARMMSTQLTAHARKEDDALFPALEQFFGREGGPTAVMRQEHREIHAEAERFRQTLRELNEVEHPEIVAQGKALRSLADRGGDPDTLRATATQVIRLLDAHFAKEEQVLFPMARRILGEAELAEVERQMEQLANA